MAGTDQVISLGKDSGSVKDVDEALSTSESKKRRRRKKDRLQQHSMELDQ